MKMRKLTKKSPRFLTVVDHKPNQPYVASITPYGVIVSPFKTQQSVTVGWEMIYSLGCRLEAQAAATKVTRTVKRGSL
jgi:hypothetical protein